MDLAQNALGDVLNDGAHQYLYDAEGRICAVYSNPVAGISTMTGYLYDADGTRIAKGSITAWSCDPSPKRLPNHQRLHPRPGRRAAHRDGHGQHRAQRRH
jgi:YD repeat-containing protein